MHLNGCFSTFSKSRKNIRLTFSLLSVFSAVFYSSYSYSQESSPANEEQEQNKNKVTENPTQNTSTENVPPQTDLNPTQETLKVKPNPVEEVAGAVGKPGFKAPSYAVIHKGKTLPVGVFKFDSITAYTFGSSGINSSRRRVDNGFKVTRMITGLQIQYGVTDRLSVGVGFPYVTSNKLAMNGTTFAANSELYKKYYDRFIDTLSHALSKENGTLCGGSGSTADCATFLNDGGSLPNSTILPIILPTGEAVTIDASAPIKNQVQNIIVNAVTPSRGETGLGDVQLGFLYNLISEESPIRQVPMYFSIGGGLRLPTGKFNIPSAFRATGGDGTLITGGGTFDAILRWNLDYIATPGFILSWQHQMEYSLTDADMGRTSMLNPSSKSSADSTTCNSLGSCGDSQGNNMRFSRKGFHYIGFFEAAWGIGNVTETLKWLGTYAQGKYNIAAKAKLNGQPIYAFGDQFFLGDNTMHKDHGVEESYSGVFGIKLSGLPYHIPLELSTEIEYPFAGRNRTISPMNSLTTLSLFFK